MARASTETLLPLDSWAELLGLNPWYFNQIKPGLPKQSQAQCEHVWYQYHWHKDFLSREEVAQVIAKAEAALADELGYWPAPRPFADEIRLYPYRDGSSGVYGAPRGSRGVRPRSVQVKWGYVQAVGVRTYALLGTANVVRSDKDGDGVEETFTVTFPQTTVYAASELALYFAAADRNNDTIAETWRVRPVGVAVDAGTGVATFSGSSVLLVPPDSTTKIDAVELNAGAAGTYVTSLDVYRVYVDATSPNQGIAIWEAPAGLVETQALVLSPRNAEVGQLAVDWELCTAPSYAPDRVQVNYVAGYPLENGQMARIMADLVAHLAAAWLPTDACGCERADRILHWWRAYPNEGKDGRPLTQKEVDDSAFGAQRGALYAWSRLRMLRQVGSVTVL